MKAIINGKIILKDSIVTDKALIFSDTIENITETDEVPENAEIIDAGGNFISPGFIDNHIHGYKGKDICDGDAKSVKIIGEEIIKNGVTGFLPTTMTESIDVLEKAFDGIRKFKEESKSGKTAEVLGCHAEGPFISPDKKGAQDIKYILKPDYSFIKKHSDIIKIITLAPEEDKGFEVIKKVKENTDIVISMGHTSSDFDTAENSISAGVSYATHLFNAMTPINHREPGASVAALNSDIYCELIVDTFHVSPAFYDILWRLKGRKLCFITDCLPAGGLPFGEYTLGGQKIIYNDIVCRLTDGTVAGSVLALNKGVYNVWKNSDIPLYECVNCASLNPAKAIGVDNKKGSLEKGKDADIVILDNEFNCLKTFKKGNLIYKKD